MQLIAKAGFQNGGCNGAFLLAHLLEGCQRRGSREQRIGGGDGAAALRGQERAGDTGDGSLFQLERHSGIVNGVFFVLQNSSGSAGAIFIQSKGGFGIGKLPAELAAKIRTLRFCQGACGLKAAAAGTLAAEDGMDFCRRFCKEFSCTEPVFVLDETLTGTATAVFRYEKRPVYNAAVTFRLEEGQVTAASGTLLSAETVTPTSESSKDLLSAAGALTAFQQMRQAESTVASSIQETYLCYELQSASLTLESAWCIVTDIASYYVNCSTGVITVG